MPKNKKSFVIYSDWERYFLALSDQQAGMLLKALFAFVSRDELLELEPMTMMAFMFMSEQIKRDTEKWEDVCEKRRVSGAKGGKARANKANASSRKQNKANQADTDTVTDTDTETDTVTDTVIETETDSKQSPVCAEGLSVGLSMEEIKTLIAECDENTFQHYVRKLRIWSEKTGKSCSDPAFSIRKWIEEDKNKAGIPKQKSKSDRPAYDLSEFESFADSFDLSRYKQPASTNTPKESKSISD